MPGWWNGILQHLHSDAGQGGTLLEYPRVLAWNSTTVLIENSVAETELATFTIPAGALAPGNELRVRSQFAFRNNSGLAQTVGTCRLYCNGFNISAAGGVVAIATGANIRLLTFEVFLYILTTTTFNTRLQKQVSADILATPAAPVENLIHGEFGKNFGLDTSINNVFSIRQQNSAALVGLYLEHRNTIALRN